MLNNFCLFVFVIFICKINADIPTVKVEEKLNILRKYFEICPRDEKFDECLKQSLQKALPRLSGNGIPELQIKSLDPLEEREIIIEYEQNSLNVHAVMRNAHLIGFSRGEIRSVESKFGDDGLKIAMDIVFPHMVIDGFFKGNGRLTALPFQLKGAFNITTDQVSGIWQLDGKKINVNNEEYLQIKQIVAQPKVGDMKIYIGNIFPGNQQLNDVINKVINDNWRVIFHEILPFAGDYWNTTLTKYANEIFSKIPYKYLIPNSRDV